MIKVAVHGAHGKLGSRIVSLIEKSQTIRFVGAVTSETIPACDVIVDVTSDSGVASLVPRLTRQKLIVGATGNLPYDELKKYAEKTAVYAVPNFSPGLQMLYPLLEQIISKAPEDWKSQIEEIHHIEKKDSPSGTAKRLSQAFKNRNVEIISKREGDVIGIHKIIFTNNYEKIEIIHEAFNRDLYADGCLKMIESIMKESRGYFSF